MKLFLFFMIAMLMSASFCYAANGHVSADVVEIIDSHFGCRGHNQLIIIDTGE